MDLTTLINEMTGKSITQNWDAVCAINAVQLSEFCFAQYVYNGPNHASARLQIVVEDSSSVYWAVSIVLGPPLVSFPVSADPASGPQCVVTMTVLRGSITSFNGNSLTIQSAVDLQPDQNVITGTINLSKVKGSENSVGKVTLNLADGAYTPTLEGIDPNSTLATDLAAAIQTYFKNNPVEYVLGSLAVDPATPACLQPTDFEFYSQAAPAGNGDGCILVFIKTNSTGNPVPQALPCYPIPDNYQATLLISNLVVFKQLMLNTLSTQFQNFRTTFTGQLNNNNIYECVGNDGELNMGIVSGNTSENEFIWSVKKYNDSSEYPVKVAMNNFTLTPNGNTVLINWQQHSEQCWVKCTIAKVNSYQFEDVNAMVTWSQNANLVVDAANNISFDVATGAPGYEPEKYNKFKKCLGNFDLVGSVKKTLANNLQALLHGYQLPSINTFSLLNLLFPASHLIKLTQAAMPGDLLAVGSINNPVTVSPVQIKLTGGGSQTFAASPGTEKYGWVVDGDKLGSIDDNGKYTAPASVKRIGIDTIIATNKSDAARNGYALVLLLPPVPEGGLVNSPASIILSNGQNCELNAFDPTRSVTNPVTANWTMGPNDPGTLTQGLGGAWSYTAPDGITQTQTITITATSTDDPALKGTTIITLQQSDRVKVIPSATKVLPGESITLTASSTNPNMQHFVWMVYPIGQGVVSVDKDDPTKQLYTAPATMPKNPETSIIAYSVTPEAMGVGCANIKIVNQ